MWAVTHFIAICNNISDFFYGLYLWCWERGYPFTLMDNWFLWLSYEFNSFAWGFYSFGQAFEYVYNKAQDMITYYELDLWLGWWLDSYTITWDRIVGLSSWFWNSIDDWWDSTRYDVWVWIEQARDWTILQLNEINLWLAYLDLWIVEFRARLPRIDEIDSWWRNWTGNVLSAVNTWWTSTLTEVQGLINGAFIEREPFWAGWQDWRDKVTEFFTDPEDWLYKAMDRIVERFW